MKSIASGERSTFSLDGLGSHPAWVNMHWLLLRMLCASILKPHTRLYKLIKKL